MPRAHTQFRSRERKKCASTKVGESFYLLSVSTSRGPIFGSPSRFSFCCKTIAQLAGRTHFVNPVPAALLNYGTVTFGDRDAWLLRENSDDHRLVKVARTVAETLAHWDIPHLIVGGVAVQEHGYPRFTIDVDVVVPDVLAAAEFLTADVAGPFRRVPGVADRLVDTRFGVTIDLLPAGGVLRHGCEVPFPEPTEVSEEPRVVSLPDLVSLKLDSYRVSPLNRAKDFADVIELIKWKNLPRDLPVAAPVRQRYIDAWDGLRAEGARLLSGPDKPRTLDS